MNAPLFEQFRPRQWSDVVGQDKILAKLATLRKRGLSGRAYWISGQSGTGKTTIARLIASEIASDWSITEIDAQDATPSALRDAERGLQTFGFGEKPGQALIINEAHGLRRDAIRQLLVFLERIPSHVVVCFTTTREGQESLFEDCDDAAPLLSRCIRLDLARRDLAKPFAERAKAIAESQGLDGAPIDRYVALLQKCRNNLRAALSAIEAGELLVT